MAQIDERFSHEPIFPKVMGSYKIHFSDEEEAILEKWKSDEHIYETSLISSGRGEQLEAKPYETLEERKQWPIWEENFNILHLNKNILKNCSDFDSISHSILDIANHFVRNAYGITLPKGCYLDFCDSWIIRLRGRGEEGSNFRKHNHSFSWLTGVCYLDDSDCDLGLHNGGAIGTTFDHDNYPFIFMPDAIEPTLFNSNDISERIEKGKVVIFNSRMDHSLFDNGPLDDTRFSIAFNIWPYGKLSGMGGAMLEYQAPEARKDL